MRIKRQPKAGETSSLGSFILKLETAPDHELTVLLSQTKEWHYPRTDLQFWIKTLNRFDAVLETVCRDYQMSAGDVQLNDFTPKTKSLVIAILAFTKLLLEHATNKRIYQSYDRINDLYLTKDLDVLEATLRLALRPSQIYRKTEAVAQDRLMQLSQSWNAREHGLHMIDLARDQTTIPAELQQVNFQYYHQINASSTSAGVSTSAVPPVKVGTATPATTSKGKLSTVTTPAAAQSKQSFEGLVNVHVDKSTLDNKSATDIYADVLEQHQIAPSGRLALFHKIRIVQSLRSANERRRLLVIRLLSLAVLSPAASDSSLTSRLFIYEPELISKIAELVQVHAGAAEQDEIALSVRAAALYALDGFCRTRSRITEVFSSINVSVSHGILIGIVRRLVGDLSSNSTTKMSTEYLDALFTLLATIQSHNTGSNGMVSAGIIPLMVELTKTTTQEYSPVVTRTVNFLDNSSYGYTSAANAFLQAGGITVFVDKIKALVDQAVEGENKQQLAYNESTLLKSLLRSLTRTMSISGTQGEGLRTLIDSSLPTSTKTIMQHSTLFGSQIYALALGVMTTFVHNEPTSLTILQEQGLPDAFYKSVEDNIDASFDVLSAVPNAIGALCLNDAGREQFNNTSVIPKLFSLFTLESHAKLLAERENASLFGAAMDELIRHHPSLKGPVMTSISDTLAKIVELGKDYEPPSVVKGKLISVKRGSQQEQVPDQADVEMAAPTAEVTQAGIGNADVSANEQAANKDKMDKERDKDNLVLGYIDVFARYLEGILQNHSHAKEFAKGTGMESLCDLLTLPCIPAHFHESPHSLAISALFRIMGEITPAPVLAVLLSRTRTILDTTKYAWSPEAKSTITRFEDMLKPIDDEQLQRSNKSLRELITLRTFVGLLEQVVPQVLYAHSRGVITSALQALNGTAPGTTAENAPETLADLGRLHRSCLKENILLKALSGDSPTLSGQEQTQALVNPGGQPSPVLPRTSFGRSQATENAFEIPQQDDSDKSLMERNVRTLKELMSQSGAAIQSLFAGIIGRPPPRRAPDLQHRQQAALTAQKFGAILADYLDISDGAASITDAAYAIVMVKTVTMLCGKEKWSANPRAMLPVRFEESSGLDRLIAIYRQFFDFARQSDRSHSADLASPVDPTETESKLRTLQAFGGMRIALDLLEKVASRKLPELNPSYRSELHRSEPNNSTDGSESIDLPAYTIRARAAIFDVIRDTWSSPICRTAPPNVVRSVFRTLTSILAADFETAESGVSSLPSMVPRERGRVMVSEDRIRQLVDMGFSRGDVVQALRRYGNNTAAATDFLISQPHLHQSAAIRDNTNQQDETNASGTATPAAADAEMTEVAASSESVDPLSDEKAAEDKAEKAREDAKALKQKLDDGRALLKATFFETAVQLLSVHDPMIFDVRDASRTLENDSPIDTPQLSLIPLLLKSLAGLEPTSEDAALTAQLRLLALLTSDLAFRQRVRSRLEGIMDVLKPLLQAGEQASSADKAPPPWSASLLLCVESLLSVSEAPRDQAVDSTLDESAKLDTSIIAQGPKLDAARSISMDMAMKLLGLKTASEDQLSAALRMIVFLTRQPILAEQFCQRDGLSLLISPSAKISGENSQEFVALILRHLVESPSTLRAIMEASMQDFFTRQRGRNSDVHAFVHGMKHAALRDPAVFVEVARDACKLQNTSASALSVIAASSPIITSASASTPIEALSQQQKTSETAEVASKTEDMQIDDVATAAATPDSTVVDDVLKHLMSQLLSMPASLSIPNKPADQSDGVMLQACLAHGEANIKELGYCRFLMACIAELAYSYLSCKMSFEALSSHKLTVNGTTSQAAFLPFLLHEVIPLGALMQDKLPAAVKPLRLSEWAALVITAICSETSGKLVEGSTEASNYATVRRGVLDAIAKAIKEVLASSEPTSQRYARLGALSDLCYRLLAPPSSANQQRRSRFSEDMYEQMAHLMVEKNFASLFTSALAEADLNFPAVKSLINKIMRPLQMLSKAVKRVGSKAEIKQLGAVEADLSAESGIEDNADAMSDPSAPSEADDAMEGGRQEENGGSPDLYRSSALGMYEGELEGANAEDSEAYDDEDGMEVDEDDFGDMEGPAEIVPSDVSDLSEDESDEDQNMDGDDTDQDGGSIDDSEHAHGRIDLDDEFSDDDGEDLDEEDAQDSDADPAASNVFQDDLGNFEGTEATGRALLGNAIDALEAGQLDLDDDYSDDDGQDPDEEDAQDSDADPAADNVFQDDLGNFEETEAADRALPGNAIDALEADIGYPDEEEEYAEGDEEVIDFDPRMVFGGQPPAHMTFESNIGLPGARGREPRAILVAGGPGQGVRDVGPHRLLVDSSNQAVNSSAPPARRSQNNAGLFSPLLHAIGDQLGDNMVQLIEQMFGNAMGQHPGAHVHRLGGHAATFAVPVGGGPPVAIGHHHHHHHEGEMRLARRQLQSSDASRQPSPAMNPASTNLRWDQEARAFQACISVADRCTALQAHLVNALLPKAKKTSREAKELEDKQKAEAEEQAKEAAANAQAEESQESKGETSTPVVSKPIEQSAPVPSAEETPAPSSSLAPSEAISEDPLEAMMALARSLAGGPTPASSVQADSATPMDTDAIQQPPQSEEVNQPASEPAAPEPTEETPSAPRVTIQVHGNTVDITDTGIDPEFLEALPDEMREEVINQHFRENRQASAANNNAASTGGDAASAAAPSSISPEFLDALPPDIRAEVILQETMEQTRQQRIRDRQAAIQAGTAAGTAGPTEMDPATFLATLEHDPQLRREVLMQQLQDGGREFLSTLPPGLIAEVEALQAGRRASRRPGPPGRGGEPHDVFSRLFGSTGPAAKKITPRHAIQLLDKASIATLVRLLFFPQQLEKGILQDTLLNLCDHSKSRTEIINFLLTILQDGTKDMASADKSFTQVSAKASKASTPKLSTPSSARPRGTSEKPSQSVSLPGNNEGPPGAPNLVAQRCLEAFARLVQGNEAVAHYFLTEQESLGHLSRRSTRKSTSKGKEKANQSATVLPLVILLALLDRPMLLAISGVMDSLTSLLATITRPLHILSTPVTPSPEDKVKASTDKPASADASDAQTNQPASELATPSAATSTQAQTTQLEEAKAGAEASEDENFEKRLRADPPNLPVSALASVVNILDAKEVSSKTFQQTLNLIQHLSHLPGAREIISTELSSRAQTLCQSLLPDLKSLLLALNESSNVPGSVMAKFSPASSLQAKFLRVLKTIDYIHSVKTKNGEEGKAQEAAEAQQRVQAIYSAFNFHQLWEDLGSCLTVVDGQKDLAHVGTVLLPLIEAFMVISKYEAKPAETTSTQTVTSPTSAKSIDDPLFFTFTKQHRRLLNAMVRQNPSLMSGSFSILVQNPAVLEFENKRNYFNQALHKRNQRDHYGTIPVNVRRQYVFEDSFQCLNPARRTAEQLKYGKLSVRFYDEEGVDAGGVTREWYSILARSIFNPGYALFQPSSADQLVYQPNPQSYVNTDHLPFFTFVGRIIGKSVYDGRLLEAYFTKAFYKHLLGVQVDLSDLESVDPENYRSLRWMLDNPIEGVLDLTFSVEADEWGVIKVIDLKPGGRDLAVTDENKREYVELLVKHRLTNSIKEQVQAFVSGFTSIVPAELVSIFNASELQLLISGLPDIDVDEWRANSVLQGYSASSSPVVWFWRAVRSFSQEERAKLLQFATGSSRVPLEGFGALQGMSGLTKFTITASHTTGALPSAHSCFNQLDLPNYASYEELRRMLLLAITETAGFGFA